MKYARTLIAGLALALVAGVTACSGNTPPEGCPDTAPANIKGKVVGKQKDSTKPELIASNGQECWHLDISVEAGKLVSVYVSKTAYDAVDLEDSFTRELVRATQ